MSNPKERKVVSNSDASFRPNKNSNNKTIASPTFTYLFNENETTALDTIFTHLFEELTGENTNIDS